jgi:uncharacterized membrane protein YczE
VLFGVGSGLQVVAGLGLSPWEVLHQGISDRTPISIGVAGIIVGALVLAAWFPLRQRPGVGTVLNVIVIGLMIDLTIWLVGPTDVMTLRWVYLLGGVVVVAIGSGIYIGVRLGPGPRDGLMTGLADRGFSIRRARTLIEGTALGVGWILGGTVGIGTVVVAVLIGPLVQVFLPLFDMGPLPVGSASPS